MIDWLFILALVATSIAALTFIVERGLALRWDKVVPPPLEAAADEYARMGNSALLRRVCEEHPSPLSRLLIDQMCCFYSKQNQIPLCS